MLTVLEDLSHLPGDRVFTETNIDDDAELRARYTDEVPVVLINGRVHNFWHIDPDRLHAALVEAASAD